MKVSLLLLYITTMVYVAVLSPNWGQLLGRPVLAGGLLAIVMWFPAVIGLGFAKAEGIKLKIFARPNRFFFLGPLLLMGLLICGFAAWPSIDLPVSQVLGLLAIGYLLSLTGSMVFALGEEIYWRGYLWEKLKKYPTRRAILVMGLVWGVWHYPFLLFLSQYKPDATILGTVYPEFPLWGCLLLPIFTVLLSYIIMYFRLKGGSIMVAGATHGMGSLGVSFSWMVYREPSSFLWGVTGVTGIVISFLFCLFFKLFSEKTWKKLV
ncbi:MAG: CPBP family glutamic-type intramembrane protease [Simkaniaceae bacterium]|nr:CPBP family glutamic-type intramembrane protease [Candidatus Sacchlamyda saccharinae]